MKALVTGGAGFIGSHVIDRLLADGAEVRVLDALDPQVHADHPGRLPDAVEFVHGDVRDRELVARCLEGGVDTLIHLAAAVGPAQSMYQIEHYMSMNAVGAAVVLEQAAARRDALVKVVVASSMAAYGEGLYRCPRDGIVGSGVARTTDQLLARRWEPTCGCGADLHAVPTPEQKALEPSSIYGIGKRDHEEMFLVWGRGYGVRVTALRFFNVYGPRQSLSNPYTGATAIFASRLLNGRRPIIFEDGQQSRDFVHVSDVADAVVRALDPDVADGLAVNVGSGSPTSVVDVALTLGEAIGIGVDPEIKNEFRSSDIRHCFADVSLARSVLGYEPRVSFEQGMRELVGWLADQQAVDRVDEAVLALHRRGLAR